jgi:lysozyme
VNERDACRRNQFLLSRAPGLNAALSVVLLATLSACRSREDPPPGRPLVAPVSAGTHAAAPGAGVGSASTPAASGSARPGLAEAPPSATPVAVGAGTAAPSASAAACEDLGTHPPSKLPPIPGGHTVRGVDASTPAAWRQLREQGAAFGIVQAMLGRNKTAAFGPNWAMAKQCGIPRAAYHFLSPTVDAGQQASQFLAQLGDDRGELPPIVDVELPPGCKGPCCAVSCEGWTASVSRWLKDVEQATGHQAMVYTVEDFWKECLCNTSRFALRKLWLAGYPRFDLAPRPGFGGWQRWTFYQYKGNARFGNSALDLDVFNGKQEELATLLSPGR